MNLQAKLIARCKQSETMKHNEKGNSSIIDQKRCHLVAITTNLENHCPPPTQQLSYYFVKVETIVQKMKTKTKLLTQKEVATSHIFFKIGNQFALCTLIQNANKNIEGWKLQNHIPFL
jgi:hypothetical protein